MMTGLAGLVSIAAGALAVVGLVGIFGGALTRRPRGRRNAVRVGAGAMTLAGLILMLSGLLGVGEPEGVMYGFLLLVFGTGVSVAPVFGKRGGDQDGLAR